MLSTTSSDVLDSTTQQWLQIFDSITPPTKIDNYHHGKRDERSASTTNALYGVLSLETLEDFDLLADECIAKCEEIRKEISASIECNEAAKTVTLFDSLMCTIIALLDPLQFCEYVHEGPAFQEAAQKAATRVREYASHQMTEMTNVISKVGVPLHN